MGSARFNRDQTEPINPEDTMVSKAVSLRTSEQLSVLNTGVSWVNVTKRERKQTLDQVANTAKLIRELNS